MKEQDTQLGVFLEKNRQAIDKWPAWKRNISMSGVGSVVPKSRDKEAVLKEKADGEGKVRGESD